MSGATTSAPTPSKPPPWPDLPTTRDDCDALIVRSATSATRANVDGGLDDLAIGTVLDAAKRRGWSRQIAGDEAIRMAIERWLTVAEQQGREAYLLFGTMHDAGAHVDAFRRIVGPGGARGITHVVLEQLRADGAWGGVAEAEQRGDGALVAQWQADGGASTFEALARFHAEHDYAAWKFGYAERVIDVVVDGRASGTPVLACDMPTTLQARVTGARPSDHLDRIRELHCLFALRDAIALKPPRAGKAHVAMLWGHSHARPGGFARFLPKDAAVMTIQAFGRRPGKEAPDRVIGTDIILNDPILVSLDDDGHERALLLPDTATDVDRVRRRETMSGPDSYVRVRADAASRFSIDDRAAQSIGAPPVTIKIAPGAHTYALDVGEGLRRFTIVGSVDVPAAGAAEISFDQLLDPKKRLTRVEYVAPK